MKILLAEDDPVLRCLLEELLLRWGHEPLVAEDGDAAVAFARQHAAFDVAILDWMMPGTTGPDVCRAIRDMYVERRPFVLMLTAKSQLEDIVAGLDAGADEYLTKPYRPTELAARLRAAERMMKMQDELIEARRLVAYQATHDLETGVLNRATFLSRLHALLLERQASPAPLSIVRIDVGARAGARGVRLDDELLRGIAERVTHSVSPGATIGRTGDAELLVLLPVADEAAAQREAVAVVEAGALAFRTAVGPVTVRVAASVVTACSSAELDFAWLLCALDSLAAASGHGQPTQFAFELAS